MFFKNQRSNDMSKRSIFIRAGILLISVVISGCGMKTLFVDQEPTVALYTLDNKKVSGSTCPDKRCVLFTDGGAKAGDFGGIGHSNSLVIENGKNERPDVLNLASGSGPTASTAVIPTVIGSVVSGAATMGASAIYGGAIRAGSQASAKAIAYAADAGKQRGPSSIFVLQGGQGGSAGAFNNTDVGVDKIPVNFSSSVSAGQGCPANKRV
jgi:hypothetical protein